MPLSQRSIRNLVGVHRDLDKLIKNTRTPHPIIITEGVRDADRQLKLYKDGKSKTLNSRHLSGHAVDFAVLDEQNEVTWEWDYYRETAAAFKDSAKVFGIDAEWGGDWPNFKDGTHIQLSWASYPLREDQKTPARSKTIAASIFGFPVAAYVPELFSAVKEMVGGLTWFDDSVVSYIQFGLVVLIAAFVINERSQKMKREGV